MSITEKSLLSMCSHWEDRQLTKQVSKIQSTLDGDKCYREDLEGMDVYGAREV